jgi:UDP-N-acetylmuramyl tripeptide synthase
VVTDVSGQMSTIEISGKEVQVRLPNRGLHFALDAVGALLTSRVYLQQRFDLNLAVETLNSLPPVFARGEIVEVRGQKIEFILVQNPMSFQLNLDNLIGHPERLMIAIGRDVHDPSWLWTVDMSALKRVDIVTGFNAFEMALRLAYEEVDVDLLTEDLETAIEAFLELPAPKSGVKTVIFSADSMRRIRRMLGFTDPDEVER